MFGDTFPALIRVLLLYLVVVGLLFLGFLMLARAEAATRGERGRGGPKRYAVFLIGGLYLVAVVTFVFNPSLAILPALAAIIGSVALAVIVDKRAWRRLSEPEIALLFILPAVIGIFLFYYYQIAQTIIYSLHFLDHTTKWTRETFIGLSNYLDVFRSRNFLGALRFTFYFTVVAVFFEFWIGLGMAMATFWVGRRLRGILRSIIVIPWAIPPIISAAIWKWLYNADVGMGYLMKQVGLVEEAPVFLADPILAMHSIIVADVWKMSSMIAILMIGGLAIIPQDVYDAAKVDGARAFYRFRRITLPMLTPTILVALLFRSMDALRTFDLVYGLTKGGPGTSTETLSSFAYQFYFTRARFGLGSAYGMVVFLVILTLSFFYVSRIKNNLRFKG
jgi:ABC-type sugar transport system permease subunit